MNILLNEWENKTLELTDYFVEKYFGKKENVDYYWIADDVGGCLSVADYFFSLSDIVDFIKYRYSSKKMFEYYDYRLSIQMNQDKDEYVVNIKNYKKLK